MATKENRIARQWGFCPGCIKERRVFPEVGIMKPHRKWVKLGANPWEGQMIPCNGTGQKKLTR